MARECRVLCWRPLPVLSVALLLPSLSLLPLPLLPPRRGSAGTAHRVHRARSRPTKPSAIACNASTSTSGSGKLLLVPLQQTGGLLSLHQGMPRRMAKSCSHSAAPTLSRDITMQTNLKHLSALITLLLLSACASVPNGPSAMALPGTGKSFDQFRSDDASCRQFAYEQVGGTTANQAANNSFAQSAVVGTALGAAAGAVAGGGEGAGVGAAVGLLAGSAVGAGQANMSSYEVQRRYDNAYIQCMYAKGHQVPVSGRIVTQQRPAPSPPPAPAAYPPPPPPPGYMPPSPPDAPK